MSIAFLFPGQGAQFFGMGRELIDKNPVVHDVIDRIAQACDLPIFDYCLKTPATTLCKTEVVQPAIFALSVGIASALQAQGIPQPSVFCGHSLGHFSALVASGALELEDAACLVATRGRLMAQAGSRAPGGMVVSLGVPSATLDHAILEAKLSLWRANDNLSEQIVLSCALKDLPAAEALITACGGRFKRLNVSGAFHCPLLNEEAAQFVKCVDRLKFLPPRALLIRNRDGVLMRDVEAMRSDLRSHMTAPVSWIHVMDRLKSEGVSTCIECGPGKVLKGLMLRHFPDLPVFETEMPKAFFRVVEMLGVRDKG